MNRLLLIIILFFGFLGLIYVKPIFCENYYSSFLGSIFAAVFAAFLVWVAWEELGKLSKTSSADFIHRLDNDFFTSKTRKLITLIDCGALEFKDPTSNGSQSIDENESFPYFEVNRNELDKTNLPGEIIKSLSKKKYYSTSEVDDLLLGLCENIGMLEKKGIVKFQMVYDVFAYYLELIWKDAHITNYIMYCRKEEKRKNDKIDVKTFSVDTFIYSRFQYIALKCIEYNNLHRGLCQWWWKFKRRFGGPKIEWDISNHK